MTNKPVHETNKEFRARLEKNKKELVEYQKLTDAMELGQSKVFVEAMKSFHSGRMDNSFSDLYQACQHIDAITNNLKNYYHNKME